MLKQLMKRPLLGIFLVIFIDLFGFGIIIPLLPFYAEQFGGTALTLGFLMTSYSLAQFIFAPLWGKVSDKIGRRPVLILGLIGSMAGMLVLASAQSLAWLFAGRTLAGIAGANISTAYAYVADVTTDENRAKGMGLLGAAFGLGFTLGPAVGGLLSPYGYSVPLLFGAALALLNSIYCYFVLPEPLKKSDSIKKTKLGLRGLLKNKQYFLAVSLFFLFTYAIAQMEVMFGLFMALRFGMGARELGWIMFGVGFFMVLTQGALIGRLSKRFHTKELVIVAFLLGTFGMGTYSLVQSFWPSMFALSVLAIGRGILQPSLSSYVSFHTPEAERGFAMGVMMSAASLSRVVAPPIAGLLYDYWTPTAPFFSAAFLLALSTGISTLLVKNKIAST